MSLTERLRRMEERITKLEHGHAEQTQAMGVLVDALEQEGDDAGTAPGMTLDGEQAGAERDQSTSLDG